MPTKLRFNSKFPSSRSQILVQNCLSPIRLLSKAMPARKNPVFWLAISGLFFPLDERFADKRMDRYGLLRRLCFARSHEAMNDGSRHVHCSCREIDIAPLESEQFALPDARRCSDEDQSPLANLQPF